MSEIEWHVDHVLNPTERMLSDVCAGRELLVEDLSSSTAPRVIVSARALESLNHYLESDLSREHGGVLVGTPYFDPLLGLHFVDIQAAVPALETSGSPVHLQFTAQAWDMISGIIEENFPDLVIVGWYHSHPGLGVFMSATDLASHQAFYNRPWSLALVVDPVQAESGWFIGPECAPLGDGQVLIYGLVPRLALDERLSDELEGEPVRGIKPALLQDLHWFLPLALLGLAGLLGGWLILREPG